MCCFSLMKFGVRFLVAETKSLNHFFLSLKAVNALHNLLNSMFSNISCSFVQEKSTCFWEVQEITFSCFLEILKNGLKYLVALTASINMMWRGLGKMLKEQYAVSSSKMKGCINVKTPF